jgi:hypothetical protein
MTSNYCAYPKPRHRDRHNKSVMAWNRYNKYMSWLVTGPINICHCLGQAQFIYVLAWDRHNNSMSWLGTSTINLCHGTYIYWACHKPWHRFIVPVPSHDRFIVSVPTHDIDLLCLSQAMTFIYWACPKPWHRFIGPVPSHDIDLLGLSQAMTYIYCACPKPRHRFIWSVPGTRNMSWLGTGTINLCHGLGQTQ